MGGRHHRGSCYAVFLRGINVGGARVLPMAELRELVSALGCSEVRSYIASGNLVLRTARGPAIGGAIEAAIADRYGYDVPAMVRAGAELAALVGRNPFTEADGARYVGLIAGAPDAAAIGRIDPDRAPGDRFAVIDREIYFAYPDGRGRSKLTPDYVESALGLAVTVRNWRTIERVAAMVDEP